MSDKLSDESEGGSEWTLRDEFRYRRLMLSMYFPMLKDSLAWHVQRGWWNLVTVPWFLAVVSLFTWLMLSAGLQVALLVRAAAEQSSSPSEFFAVALAPLLTGQLILLAIPPFIAYCLLTVLPKVMEERIKGVGPALVIILFCLGMPFVAIRFHQGACSNTSQFVGNTAWSSFVERFTFWEFQDRLIVFDIEDSEW